MLQETLLDLPIKEECIKYWEKVENTETPKPVQNLNNSHAFKANDCTLDLKNDEKKIKDEKHTVPLVKIERNSELEEALLGSLKDAMKDGRPSNGSGKCMKEAINNTSRDGSLAESTPRNVVMFVCANCNRCYPEQSEVKDHICDTIKNSDQKVFTGHVCDICGATYKSKSHFKEHKDCHLEPLICDICGSKFDNKKLLIQHCMTHLVVDINIRKTCKMCNKTVKGTYLDQHIASHFVGPSRNLFSCSECGKSFKTKIELNSHSISHSEERNFVCTHCKKSFKRKHEIILHLDHFHTKDKRQKYECSECPKSFCFKGYLKIHKSKAHSESRPMSCNVCGDTFKDKKCLVIHTQTHTGLKPYSCSFCHKRFAQIPHWKRHERTHTGEKPYLCKICGKAFVDSSNFEVHKITHTGLRPFKCDKCGKDYTQRSHLNSHRKTHGEERPYVCTVCGESFKLRGVLKTHVLRHSKVKPFNCKDCDRSFVQHTAFKRHKCWFSPI